MKTSDDIRRSGKGIPSQRGLAAVVVLELIYRCQLRAGRFAKPGGSRVHINVGRNRAVGSMVRVLLPALVAENGGTLIRVANAVNDNSAISLERLLFTWVVSFNS